MLTGDSLGELEVSHFWSLERPADGNGRPCDMMHPCLMRIIQIADQLTGLGDHDKFKVGHGNFVSHGSWFFAVVESSKGTIPARSWFLRFVQVMDISARALHTLIQISPKLSGPREGRSRSLSTLLHGRHHAISTRSSLSPLGIGWPASRERRLACGQSSAHMNSGVSGDSTKELDPDFQEALNEVGLVLSE